MASKITSLLLARVFLVGIVLAIAIAMQAVAARNIQKTLKDGGNLEKHPEWLGGHDGSVLIPGLGRVMMPPVFDPQNPFWGGIGDSNGGSGYIPGGDDTFVPNPGFEVPIPGNGAASAAAAKRPHP
ncbi:hypothetical protein HRI_001150100 [Hibiscus trionum]|uniref:Cell wall protein n=1 Tax=Hibiscus trionum TaxID=183268 RepID=A0A9W7LS74_HIBTR|nr:hypothetical protein HRI_001150100 [Hibiscus trionum]